MNRLLVLFLFFSVVNEGFSQQYSEHYYKRKAIFEQTADTKNEIIFLGNSITEGGDWKALFPDKNVVNRGISGDVTDGVLFRLEEVTASQPMKIFLMIGTNDLARGRSIDYVIKGTEQIIEQIKKDAPNTIIYLQTILPVNPKVGKKFSGHKSNQDVILQANSKLKALSLKHATEFIDLHRAFRNKKGELKAKYTYDGLHLSNKGYHRWKTVLNKYLRGL